MNYTDIETILFQKFDNCMKKEKSPQFVIMDHDTYRDFCQGCNRSGELFDYKLHRIMGLTIALCRTSEDGQRILEVK